MAVKTQFSETDFITLLSAYPLGELKAAEPMTHGRVQTNVLLETTLGKFVFRYYENRSYGSAMFESDLIHYLNREHYLCPNIYEDNQGNSVGTFKGKPFALFEFIEGEHLENPTEAQKVQLIQRVAELHLLTRNLTSPYQEDRWNYSPGLCRMLARQAASQINTANARAKLEWYERELAALDLPDSLPKGICHCDFHFSNVLFKAGEFKALIDFDDANSTYLIYDLATLIQPFIPGFDWDTWVNFRRDEPIFDFAEARKTVAYYHRYRPLGEPEQRHLFDCFKLSVLLDCLWYFERGEADDFFERRKIEALNRLGRERFYQEVFRDAV